MAEKYPKDRFDEIPDGIARVGAHRAPRRRGRGLRVVVWSLVAIIVLVTCGILALTEFNGRLDFFVPEEPPEASETPQGEPTAEPTIDPKVSVTVLNGTNVGGLAASAGETLSAEGVPVGVTSNASERDIAETYVYYVDPALEGSARGIAALLPESDVALSEQFAESGVELVVVLGADYARAVGG